MVSPRHHALPEILLFACLAIFWAGSARADRDVVFVQANTAYESEDYAEAEKLYRQLADAGELSEDLFFNLGNALYRQNRPGEAVLWFRKALLLNPRMAETRQNLKVIHHKNGYLEFSLKGVDSWLSRVSHGELVTLTWFAFWATLIGLAAAFALPHLRDWRALFLVCASISLAIAIAGKWGEQRHREKFFPNALAIVIAPDVKAVVSPVPGADPVVDLPPGSELRLLLDRGKWQFVAIPDDLRGWVRTEHVGKLVE